MIDPSLIEALEQIKYRAVIEAPAPSIPGKLDLTTNAVAAIAKSKAGAAAKVDGAAAREYRERLSGFRSVLANELPDAAGYIQVLDRTGDIAGQVQAAYHDPKFAKKFEKGLKGDPGAYAVQHRDSSGKSVCMVVTTEPGIDAGTHLNKLFGFDVKMDNARASMVANFFDTHEFGHCVGGASEGYADTFAALRMIQQGATADDIRFMASLREYAEWAGSTDDPHFSSSVLWKIAEMRDDLAKNPKFQTLPLPEIAGLATSVHETFSMKKKEQIFVRDVRQAINAIGAKKAHFVPMDGGLQRVSLHEWMVTHQERLPWLKRIGQLVDGLRDGTTASLSRFHADEKDTMSELRALSRKGDPGARQALKILTDGTVAPMPVAKFVVPLTMPQVAYTDIIEFKPDTQKIAFAPDNGAYAVADRATNQLLKKVEVAKDTRASTEPPATINARELETEAPAKAAPVASPAVEASPDIRKEAPPAAKPRVTVDELNPDGTPRGGSAAKEAPAAVGNPVAEASVTGAPSAPAAPPIVAAAPAEPAKVAALSAETPRSWSPDKVREAIRNATSRTLDESESLGRDIERSLATMARSEMVKAASVETPGPATGLNLPDAPSRFDAPPKAPTMIGMASFATAEPTIDWNKTALLTATSRVYDEIWSPNPSSDHSAMGYEPQFNGVAFLDTEDISRMLDAPLEFGPFSADREFVQQIVDAAEATDIDPVTLLAMCAQESSFGKRTEAETSTARGPFQMLEGTWLALVKKFGPKHGLEKEADQIELVKGKLDVSDKAEKQKILNLRHHVYLSAVMTGEMFKAAKTSIENVIKRPMTEAETYLPHFMGEGGARQLLKTLMKRPQAKAASIFPKAAKANAALFYDTAKGKRRPVTIEGLHEKLTGKIERLRVHFADAVNVINDGVKIADIRMPISPERLREHFNDAAEAVRDAEAPPVTMTFR